MRLQGTSQRSAAVHQRLGLTAAIVLLALPAFGSEVRDGARMFRPEAIEKSVELLNKLERETGVPTLIETQTSLDGRSIDEVSQQHARAWGRPGVYVLITQKEHKIQPRDYKSFLGHARRKAIEGSFGEGVRQGGVDAGLQSLANTIREQVLSAGRPGAAPRGGAAAPANGRRGGGGRSSATSILLVLGLVVVGVLVLGRVFGAKRQAPPYGPGGMPGGYGPMQGGNMMNPGGGGYGPAPARGGFWSGMLGGLGGAVAGNWLYDQMSGRHHGHQDLGSSPGMMDPGSPADDWGGDAGGGDWGGGGGGDFGGGGGDGGW
jgi:uncharacterized protein